MRYLESKEKRKFCLLFASAVFLTVILIILFQAVVKNQKKVSVFEEGNSLSIEWNNGKSRNLAEYIQNVNQEVVCDDITIKVDEVVLSKGRMLVKYLFYSDKFQLNDSIIEMAHSVYINGQKVEVVESNEQSKNLNNHTYQLMIMYPLGGYYEEGNASVDIKISCIYIQHLSGERERSAYNGNWDFRFNANGDSLNQNTKWIDLGCIEPIKDGEIVLNLKEFYSNSIETILIMNSEQRIKDSYYIIGEDEFGRQFLFLQKSIDENSEQYGNDSAKISARLNFYLENYENSLSYGEIGENVEQLTLQVYKYSSNDIDIVSKLYDYSGASEITEFGGEKIGASFIIKLEEEK